MGDGKTSFFVLDLILLFVFIGMISIIFGLRRVAFMGELFILIILIFLAFISLIGIYNRYNWGYLLLSLVFAVILADLLFIYYLERCHNNGFIMTAVLTALGFIISIAGIKRKKIVNDMDGEDREEIVEEVKKSFVPGKYVASKTGATYHVANCDWAKKIKKKNQVWFDSEKEAKKDRKAHSCIKDKVYTNF
ncbi:MAG: hypothetical protein ABIJ08_04025 [Nanoarchaeota archaeon]